MGEFILYGLDEAGETAATEQVRVDRQGLAELARERLMKFHAVEIWEGPLCVLRTRRRSEEQA